MSRRQRSPHLFRPSRSRAASASSGTSRPRAPSSSNVAWQERSAASPDGNGRVVLVDTDVVAGHRYSYRLRLTGRFAGEVSLDIPLTHRLSLAGFHPNPAVGPLSVSFSLATAAPARLEILDVAGRRVHARTLDRPVPGTQQLSLSGVRLAPGVYVIRLEQSGSRVVTRSVVLR